MPAAARQRIALRACFIAGAILAGTALIGDWLLNKLGISLPAFRIAGGLLLFAVASEMVFGVRVERQSKEAENAIEEHVARRRCLPARDPADGGARRDYRNASARRPGDGQLAGARVPARRHRDGAAACLAAFCIAGRIDRLIGITGNVVLSRLLGVILAALAVQYVIDGVRAVLNR